MEDNGFQTLTWLNLKGPKLRQTSNKRCPAAKHRRAQKHKLLPQQHQWLPKPPCFPHLLHRVHFHPTWVSHPTSQLFKVHSSHKHMECTALQGCDVNGSFLPHNAALRANRSSKSLILSLEDQQYLSFTIWILIYCIGKYIIAKHTCVCECVCVRMCTEVYVRMHTHESMCTSLYKKFHGTMGSNVI